MAIRFHSTGDVPEAGTWQEDSWRDAGDTNVWSLMSCDENLGYVYLPFGTPTNDYYGGHRPGENLFAESVVALDAETGRRVWHFQTVRHGLWDYDLPAAPNLVDITVDGRVIRAVAQVSKQGFVYVLDRVSGQPVPGRGHAAAHPVGYLRARARAAPPPGRSARDRDRTIAEVAARDVVVQRLMTVLSLGCAWICWQSLRKGWMTG